MCIYIYIYIYIYILARLPQGSVDIVEALLAGRADPNQVPFTIISTIIVIIITTTIITIICYKCYCYYYAQVPRPPPCV